MEATREVGGDDVVPILLTHTKQEIIASDARIVYQNVYAFPLLKNFFAGLAYGVAIGNVHRQRLCESAIFRNGLSGGATGIRGLAHANDFHAISGKRRGNCTTDTATGAGHKGKLGRVFFCHKCNFRSIRLMGQT
jgi:hypothetical protein